MIRLALLIVVAIIVFVLLRLSLRHKKMPLSTFFVLYGLSLLGLVLLYLGATGKLHWLFAVLGGLLPFLTTIVKGGFKFLGLLPMFKLASQWFKGERSGQQSSSTNGDMDRKKALEILGLEGNPSEQEIIDAHRKLIQKLHPDRGGSTFLATQINQAKDYLLSSRGKK